MDVAYILNAVIGGLEHYYSTGSHKCPYGPVFITLQCWDLIKVILTPLNSAHFSAQDDTNLW